MNPNSTEKPACMLLASSKAGSLNRPGLLYVPSRILWYLRNQGPAYVMRLIFKSCMDVFLSRSGIRKPLPREKRQFPDEVLNLQPGEWVEVKPLAEILKTLDEKATCKGLVFTPEMKKLCGQRFLVFKRLEYMFNECNREKRKIRNTVLLEGAMCTGNGIGCDRSCFHYWREVWLRRVENG